MAKKRQLYTFNARCDIAFIQTTITAKIKAQWQLKLFNGPRSIQQWPEVRSISIKLQLPSLVWSFWCVFVCGCYVCQTSREKKTAVFDIEISEMVEYCRWWRAKTKYYPISCVHQFSMYKMCSIAFCSRFLHCDSVALFFIVSFNFQLVLSVGNYSSCRRSMSFFFLVKSISITPSP